MNRDQYSPQSQITCASTAAVGSLWQAVFFFSTIIGFIALAVFLLSIINRPFGLVAVENKVDPATLSTPLEHEQRRIDVDPARQHEPDPPAHDRTRPGRSKRWTAAIFTIWSSTGSSNRPRRELSSFRVALAAQGSKLKCTKISRMRTSIQFLVQPGFLEQTWMSATPQTGRGAHGIARLVIDDRHHHPICLPHRCRRGHLPGRVCTASRFNRIIQTNIDNLAGVPSIVYGILGLAIFVRTLLEPHQRGVFGLDGWQRSHDLICRTNHGAADPAAS